MVSIPIWTAGTTRIGLNGVTSEYTTQRDIKLFRQWALRKGFTMRKTYKNESIKRAFTLTGTGDYAGLTFQVIDRITLSQDHPSRHGKTYRRDRYDYTKAHRPKIGEYWNDRHCREDCDLISSVSIAGFYHGNNLSGYYGLNAQDIMNIRPIWKLHHLLMAPPCYRKSGWRKAA